MDTLNRVRIKAVRLPEGRKQRSDGPQERVVVSDKFRELITLVEGGPDPEMTRIKRRQKPRHTHLLEFGMSNKRSALIRDPNSDGLHMDIPMKDLIARARDSYRQGLLTPHQPYGEILIA
jgi:hypothetical protein